jgi:vacuolar-type H+-ATPase subunit H
VHNINAIRTQATQESNTQLQEAQKAAEKLLVEARREAENIRRNARDEEQQQRASGAGEAKRIVDDARAQASRILEEALKEHWELVVENGMRPGARKAIEESGWPFLVLGDGGKCVPSRVESCVGQIENRMGLALSDFVHACVKRGVRSVVQFLYAEGGFDASEMLAMPGVGCETVRIPRCRSQFDMYSRAYTAMKALLKRLGGRLPDVFLFTDDHLTQGAVLALMEHGVRVPEDVRVVTHSNRGLGPFWTKPFTRLEMNPVAHGAEIADAILAYLRTRRLPAGIVLGSEWTPGETF